jgi:hypothetical protein
MMVMTMGFASYTMQDYFVSKTFQQSNTCFYLASAGMDYVSYLIKHNMLIYPYYTDVGDAYDADLFDGSSATCGVGEIVNVYYKNSSNPRMDGTEFLMINRLAGLDETLMFTALDTSNACGTFVVKVTEAQDPNASSDITKRVLFVTSTGYIRKVPSDKWDNDPATWDTRNYAVLAQRTLIARIPYRKAQFDFDSIADGPFKTRNIITDGWFEKFR